MHRTASTNETEPDTSPADLQSSGLACRHCRGYGNFAPDPDCRPTSDCSRCDATGVRGCDYCHPARAEVVLASTDVACATCAAAMACDCCGVVAGHAALTYRTGFVHGFYCERCCEEFSASAERQAKRDEWECRGDYLREQQMERGL